MTKFKLCPFCGNRQIAVEPAPDDDGLEMLQVTCLNARCFAHVKRVYDGSYDETMRNLAKRWNRRVEPDADAPRPARGA
jgi:hypothetical protein